MTEINYWKTTKQYFKKFLNPLGNNDNENLLKYYDQYEYNIKSFIEKELGWNMNIYFAKIANSNKHMIEWFYIIENGQEIYSSDEYQNCKMSTYESALNYAIRCVFKNIYQITI